MKKLDDTNLIIACLVIIAVALVAEYCHERPAQPDFCDKQDACEIEKEDIEAFRARMPQGLIDAQKLDTERSSKWRSLRDRIIKAHPFCAYCGATERLQAHHIRPFHLQPELELKEPNVIVLCEVVGTDHHLHIGHLGNFRSEGNPNVVEECRANELKLRAAGLWPVK